MLSRHSLLTRALTGRSFRRASQRNHEGGAASRMRRTSPAPMRERESSSVVPMSFRGFRGQQRPCSASDVASQSELRRHFKATDAPVQRKHGQEGTGTPYDFHLTVRSAGDDALSRDTDDGLKRVTMNEHLTPSQRRALHDSFFRDAVLTGDLRCTVRVAELP